MRRILIRFESGDVAPGASESIQNIVQLDTGFVPDRLQASGGAGYFTITEIEIGGVKQFMKDREIPAFVFVESNSVGSFGRWPKGTTIAITVRNDSDQTAKFSAVLMGENPQD